MLTKEQKKEHVALSSVLIKNSKSLVFADFSGAPTKEIEKLKAELKGVGATYKVFKKRLLKFALQEAGIPVDSLDAKAPVVTMFAKGDMTSVASPVYKFSKELAKRKINFSVLGAFDREGNKSLTVEEFNIIARLPSREVLLAQVMGAMTGPLRKLLATINEVAKKNASTQTVVAAPAEVAVDEPVATPVTAEVAPAPAVAEVPPVATEAPATTEVAADEPAAA